MEDIMTTEKPVDCVGVICFRGDDVLLRVNKRSSFAGCFRSRGCLICDAVDFLARSLINRHAIESHRI